MLRKASFVFKLENSRDFGKEAVEILLQYMENKRKKIIVFFSGSKNEMLDLFGANRGLSSRMTNHIEFPPLNLDDLDRILKIEVAAKQYVIWPGVDILFRQYLKQQQQIRLVYNDALFNNGSEISKFLRFLRPILANRVIFAFIRKLTVEDVMIYTVCEVFDFLQNEDFLQNSDKIEVDKKI